MVGAGQPLVWGDRARSQSAIAVGVRSCVGRWDGGNAELLAGPCAGVPVWGLGRSAEVPVCTSKPRLTLVPE